MRRLIAALGLALAAGGALAQSAPRPALWTTAELRAPRELRLVGTVQPQVRTDLGFRVLGRLISRTASVGDRVEAGRRLAAIDATAFELALRAARADLADAEAQLANAAAEESRQITLVQNRTAAKQTLENAEQQRQAAEAVLAGASAALVKAEEQLGYTWIASEYDGVITAVEADVGETVSPGQTVLTVARPDIREAVVDAPEEFLSDLALGGAAEIALELDPRIRVAGAVREIAPQADASTRTHRVRITLADPLPAFRLGTTVIVTLAAPGAPAILLPATAILDRDGAALVWVIGADGAVTPRPVARTALEGGMVAVTSGIDPGERIVTAGVNRLTEGQIVRVGDASR
jgi:RND family efflux transporter MFP subunit